MPEVTDYKLKKSQVEILNVLQGGKHLTRRKISERTGVAENMLCPFLGSIDKAMRVKAEKRVNCISLVSLGYVEVQEFDIDGLTEIVYSISKKGQEAMKVE